MILDRAPLDAALSLIPAAVAARLGDLDATALLGAAIAVVLVVGLAAYRLGVRHRAAQARRLRERLVGRLQPGAP